MDVDVTLTGADAPLKLLQSFANPRRANNLAKRVGRHAFKRVRKAARENAKAIDDPATREAIHKNIVTKTGRTRSKSVVNIKVGVRGGASSNQYSADLSGLSGGDTRHWRFIEFGTRHMAATPFMRTALSKNIQEVTDDFVKRWRSEIDKELLKYKAGK